MNGGKCFKSGGLILMFTMSTYLLRFLQKAKEKVQASKKKVKINTHMNHDCKNSCVQLMTRISTRNYTIYGRCNVCSRPVRYEVRNPVDVSIFRAAKRGGHAHLGVSGVAEEGKAKGRINAQRISRNERRIRRERENNSFDIDFRRVLMYTRMQEVDRPHSCKHTH